MKTWHWALLAAVGGYFWYKKDDLKKNPLMPWGLPREFSSEEAEVEEESKRDLMSGALSDISEYDFEEEIT